MKKTIIRRLMIICYTFCSLMLLIFSLVIESKALTIMFLISALPFISLVVYTVRYIENKILKPLDNLTIEAEKISNGDLSNEIKSDSDDEIGQFILVFNNMRRALYKQQKKQEKFENERKNFVDSISHDLKNPLASISAYIEALQDGMISTPNEEIQYYKIIENKIAILSELSNQLSMSYETPDDFSLSLNKVHCYTWSMDFLDDISVESAMNSININLSNNISVNDNSCILIDIHQLDRVLFNMTSNALRYCNKLLSISTTIENKMFIILLKNDGAKVKSENLERIFERFYTEEEPNDQGHLGLGLYLAKTIIHAMNGDINVKKKDDIIEFKLFLPIL